MAETILEIKITIVIDTNKATYEGEFESMEAAKEWHEETLNSLN